MPTFVKVLSGIVLPSFLLWACMAARSQQYEIDKPSPDGSYRVKVDVKRGQADETLDQAKFRFFIGDKVVEEWDWKQPNQYEPDFDSFLPIEWIDNQILNIGKITNRPPYRDELLITNSSGEYLNYFHISYGRTQSYLIFALPPGKQITVLASPWFTTKDEDFSFGYGGKSQSGKSFTNVIKAGARVFPGEQKKFAITIWPHELQ